MRHHTVQAKQRGFTLLELSIVLVVLALFATSMLTVTTQTIRRDRYALLTTRMDAIEVSMLNFRRLYGRLPCPADGSIVVTNQSYGLEADVPGNCRSGTPAANFDDGFHTVVGVLPTKTLGLPDEYMIDPWGGRLTYAIDKRLTSGGAFTTYPVTDTTIGSMSVTDTSANTLINQVSVVILSHGPDGHGAYQLSGTRKSSGSNNANQQTNCHCDNNATATAFTNSFVSGPATGNAGDIHNIFDDLVRYYLRTQYLSASESLR